MALSGVAAAGFMCLSAACSLSSAVDSPTPAVQPQVRRPTQPVALRVFHDPYDGVDWAKDARLRTQLHDHLGTNHKLYLAYAAAHYDVVGLQEYSGVASLPYTLKKRLWPPDSVFSRAFLDSIRSISVLIPSAEDVEFLHLTSPFLTTYIAKWEPAYYPARQPWMCASTQECIDLIKKYGGVAIVAHPWSRFEDYQPLRNFDGMEVYSAFARYRQLEGKDSFYVNTDRNAVMEANWDRVLMRDQTVFGVGANDHFGPGSEEVGLDDRTRDSGKSLVLAHARTIDAVHDAILRGALFAIKDVGVVKGLTPNVRRITVAGDSIALDTDDAVTWIANGAEVATGRMLQLSRLPAGSIYVRARVSNSEGSTLYTQAFALRPVGDTNGDGLVNDADLAVCQAVARAADADPNHAKACGGR